MTALTGAQNYRPPARAFGRLVALEGRMTRREPWLPLLGLALPLFFLVVFSTVPTFKKPMPADPRFTVSAYLMPMWIALAVSLIALFCLPVPFVRDRESHWLRRISTTPAPPSWLLGAHTVVNLVLALLAVAVLTIGGGAFLGMAAPDQLAGYVVAALLLVTAMFAVGLLVTAVAPTPGAAAGLGNAVYILLLFFGGLWIQRQDMAPALRAISDFTPLMAAGQALRGAMIGIFPTASQLLVLVGWTVVCGAAAIRFFRWE